MKNYFILPILLALFSPLVLAQAPPPPPGGSGGAATQFTFNLSQGWNMISTPVGFITPDQIKGCDIQKMYSFNGKSYAPMDSKSLMNPLEGYWALVSNDCTATVLGSDPANGLRQFGSKGKARISLGSGGYKGGILARDGSGWHIISSSKSWDQIKGSCELGSPIYAWNPKANKYDVIPTSQKLDDSKGYWAYIKKQGSYSQENRDPYTEAEVCLISEGPTVGQSGDFCQASFKIRIVANLEMFVDGNFTHSEVPSDVVDLHARAGTAMCHTRDTSTSGSWYFKCDPQTLTCKSTCLTGQTPGRSYNSVTGEIVGTGKVSEDYWTKPSMRVGASTWGNIDCTLLSAPSQ